MSSANNNIDAPKNVGVSSPVGNNSADHLQSLPHSKQQQQMGSGFPPQFNLSHFSAAHVHAQTQRDAVGVVNEDSIPGRVGFENEFEDESGTTTAGICGIDFLAGVTDGRRMDSYMGTTITDNSVKTHWLCKEMFALCSGRVATFQIVNRRVRDYFASNLLNPPTVEQVANRVKDEANRRDQESVKAFESSCSYIVIGKDSSTYPCLFKVSKTGGSTYTSTKEDEVVCGSGTKHAKMELEKFRRTVDRLKGAVANAGLKNLTTILRKAVVRATRNDLKTDGAIHVVTMTKSRPTKFEVVDSSSGAVIREFRPHFMP